MSTEYGIRDAAGRLGNIAEIQALVVRNLHWTANEIPLDPSVTISPETTFQFAHGKSGSILRFQIKSFITGKVPAGELFRMECTHEAFFTVPEGDPTTDLELGAFCRVSVFFMVYPFIRETLYGLTGNAGLPVVLLRPWKIPFNPAHGSTSGVDRAELATPNDEASTA